MAARWPFHFGNARQTSGWQVDDAARPLKVIKTCSKSQCRRAPRATMRHGARWGVPKIHRAPVLGSPRAKWPAYAVAFIETVGFCFSWSATNADRLSTKTRIAEDRLLLLRV